MPFPSMRLKAYSLLPILFLISLFLFQGCQKPDDSQTSASIDEPLLIKDLAEIRKDGKLKALTIYSNTSYFLYRGKPMGYEYELLQRLAEYLELELEMIVADDIDDLIDMLNRGEGDLIAHRLTITASRQQSVEFSNYLYLTKQVLVQKKPDNWRTLHWHKLENALVHDAIELLDDTVSVRNKSSYKERVLNLSEELGGTIHLEDLPGNMATDAIVREVAKGNIKYTVADNNIAKLMASYYPILDVDVPVSFSQRIAWATRKNSPELMKSMNVWLEGMKRNVDYNVIYNKYFKNKKDFRRRVKSKFYSLNEEEISPYDSLIKHHSRKIGWDWRLVASLIYQESRFDPNNSSWANAKGLMQIMPKTAKELGVTDRTDPRQSIRGGTAYLKELWNSFENVTDSIQRKKFVMAAYNCGLYHVKDAQKLAKKRGLNPKYWDDHVEDMILALRSPKNYNDPVVKYGYVRGVEPYNYVNQIFERYVHYKQFIAR